MHHFAAYRSYSWRNVDVDNLQLLLVAAIARNGLHADDQFLLTRSRVRRSLLRDRLDAFTCGPAVPTACITALLQASFSAASSTC